MDYCDVFNQLFGLSFWRHPFTAIQCWISPNLFWWRNKLIYFFFFNTAPKCNPFFLVTSNPYVFLHKKIDISGTRPHTCCRKNKRATDVFAPDILSCNLPPDLHITTQSPQVQFTPLHTHSTPLFCQGTSNPQTILSCDSTLVDFFVVGCSWYILAEHENEANIGSQLALGTTRCWALLSES